MSKAFECDGCKKLLPDEAKSVFQVWTGASLDLCAVCTKAVCDLLKAQRAK